MGEEAASRIGPKVRDYRNWDTHHRAKGDAEPEYDVHSQVLLSCSGRVSCGKRRAGELTKPRKNMMQIAPAVKASVAPIDNMCVQSYRAIWLAGPNPDRLI